MKIDDALKLAHQVRAGNGEYKLPARATMQDVCEAIMALATAAARYKKAFGSFAEVIGSIEGGEVGGP